MTIVIIMESMRLFCRQVFRTKTINFDTIKCRYTPRFKGLLHLLIQGIGSGSALGIYVITCTAAKDHAGPAVILSALGGAIIAWITASCYSELSCRLPLMGTSYLYCYTIFGGEIMAFILGWNLIIDAIINLALAALALSFHINILASGSINRWIMEKLGSYPWDYTQSPPIIAVGCLLIMALSLTFQTCLFVMYMLVLIAVTFLTMFHVNADNWGTDEVFFRFGSRGIVTAAAMMTSTLTGLKSIAMSAEETHKPSRNIPITHTLTVVASFTAFFVISALITLSLASEKLQVASGAPLLILFDQLRVKNAKYFIGVGSICGFILMLLVQLNYAERMMFSMARDGLLPSWLGKWSYSTNTPWPCRCAVTVVAVIFTLFIPFDSLLHMSSIGCLLSFTVTCLATIMARYDPCQIGLAQGHPMRKTVSAQSFTMSPTSSQQSELTGCSDVSEDVDDEKMFEMKELTTLLSKDQATSMTFPRYNTRTSLSSELDAADSDDEDEENSNRRRLPDLHSYHRIRQALTISVTVSICLGLTMRFGGNVPIEHEWLPVSLGLTWIFINICCSLAVCRAASNGMELVYTAGGMPVLQMIAVMGLIVMMCHLNGMAWMRLGTVSAIGLIVYFGYSKKRSATAMPMMMMEELMCYENRAAATGAVV